MKPNYITVCYKPVRISGTIPDYYFTLRDAYNAAGDGDTIQSQNIELNEDMLCNGNKTVILEAGYDCNYSGNPGTTTVNGDMTITSGTVIIQSGKLVVQ